MQRTTAGEEAVLHTCSDTHPFRKCISPSSCSFLIMLCLIPSSGAHSSQKRKRFREGSCKGHEM